MGSAVDNAYVNDADIAVETAAVCVFQFEIEATSTPL